MSKYDELKWLAEEVQMSAAGTWTLQTGCSWRRIGNEFGDGNVLRPCTHQYDGWPDLSAAPYVLEYLIAAQPAAILELIADNERMATNAQRYQFLRSYSREGLVVRNSKCHLHEAFLDMAIDVAMQEAAK